MGSKTSVIVFHKGHDPLTDSVVRLGTTLFHCSFPIATDPVVQLSPIVGQGLFFWTQFNCLISCYGKSVEHISESLYPLISLVHSTGFP